MNISKDIKDNQIISIVGPTATGKTAYALNLAKELLADNKFKTVHLLSADSKQVYIGLENLTGADVPSDFSLIDDEKFSNKYFANEEKSIFLHGVTIIETDQEWSVAHFQKLFENIVANLNKTDFLIVVGGTGFYQQQVFNSAASISVPQNKELRDRLEKLELSQLKTELKNLDNDKFAAMNNSDVNNPRRLIRAIEIAFFKKDFPLASGQQGQEKKAPIFYLDLPKELREEKIKQRVVKRFDKAKKEVEKQLQKENLSALAASTLGFAELKNFIEGKTNKETCINLWQVAEIQYAKRQLTWWKKETDLCYI